MEDLKIAFSNGDFTAAEDEADAIIDSNGVTSIEKHAPEYRRLCAKILEVDIRLWPILKKARLLDFSYRDDIPKLFPEINDGNLSDSLAAVHPEKAETLKTVINEHWKRKQSGWGAAAIEAYERYKKRMLEHFGEDRSISTIDYKEMERFRDELKSTSNKGRPIAEKTVNLHIDYYVSVFHHAVQSGRITLHESYAIALRPSIALLTSQIVYDLSIQRFVLGFLFLQIFRTGEQMPPSPKELRNAGMEAR